MEFGPFAVAIAFWIFVAIATVAGIVGDYKKRQLTLEPLRAAIEKGQQLDPAVVERLMAPAEDTGINPTGLMVGGHHRDLPRASASRCSRSSSAQRGTGRLLPGHRRRALVARVRRHRPAGRRPGRRALRRGKEDARTGRVTARAFGRRALGQAAEATVVALAMNGDAAAFCRARAAPPVGPAQPAAAPEPRSGARG